MKLYLGLSFFLCNLAFAGLVADEVTESQEEDSNTYSVPGALSPADKKVSPARGDRAESPNRCQQRIPRELWDKLPLCPEPGKGLHFPSYMEPTGTVVMQYDRANLPLIKAVVGASKRTQAKLVLVENKNMVYASNPPPKLEDFMKKNFPGYKYETMPVAGKDYEQYVRDPFLPAVDSQGRPVVVAPPTDKKAGNFWDQLAKFCGGRVEDKSNVVSYGLPESLDGGNFLPMPGNTMFVESHTRLKDHPQIPKDVYQDISTATFRMQKYLESKGQNLFYGKAALPVLSHADEIFSYVKTGNGKCDFTMLAISPELAVGMVKDKTKLTPGIVDRSKEIQARIDADAQRLSKHLKKKLDCAKDIPFVKLPGLLYDAEEIEHNSFQHPNPVNGLVITPIEGRSHFISAKTGIPEFDSYIEAELKKVGVPFELVDAKEIDMGAGGVHCSTNQFSLCRPR